MSDTSPPAFPYVELDSTCNVNEGMSLRDYFAAKAMGSIILDPWYANQRIYNDVAQNIANESYVIADAMLAERAK